MVIYLACQLKFWTKLFLPLTNDLRIIYLTVAVIQQNFTWTPTEQMIFMKTLDLHISRAEERIRIMQCTYMIRSSSGTWLISGIQDDTSVDPSLMDSSIESWLWACWSISFSVSVVSWWISLAWLLATCLWIDDGSLNDCSQHCQRAGEVFWQVGGTFLEATNAANV